MPIRDLPPITPDPVIEALKKEVDRTLLRDNLKRTPTERLQALMEMQRQSEEMQRAMRTQIHPGHVDLFASATG